MDSMDVANPPPYRGAQMTLMISSILFTAFGSIAILLRLIGRWLIVGRFGIDDLTMLAGMVLTGGYLFEILYGTHFGMGLHGKDIGPEDMPKVLMVIYSVQLTYNTIIALVKISIVCFYLRLATAGSSLRRNSLMTIAFLVVFFIATQITTTVQCIPIKGNWDITGSAKKKCIDTTVYFYVVAGINILTDLWILGLPIKTLKNIKRSKRDKIVLFVLFGVGGFSCLSGIIRLYTIRVFSKSKDPFFDGVPINIWSMIEINVAVVCASVPAMKPLFTKTVRERMSGNKNSRRTGYVSYGHQMSPLSNEEVKSHTGHSRGLHTGYSAKATSKQIGGSEERIISQIQGIEYEREYTVEESYVGSAHKSPSESWV